MRRSWLEDDAGSKSISKDETASQDDQAIDYEEPSPRLDARPTQCGHTISGLRRWEI